MKSREMNCNRCFSELIPDFHTAKELRLQCVGITVRLNVLNCSNCRISIYLKFGNGMWTHVDSISTEKKVRKNGWENVEDPNELVKFYILSQVVYNQREGQFHKDAFFDFPDENDIVKILWENGYAIGFYTAKRKESIVFDTMEVYEMNTLDTAYIMKSHRRKGHGVSILDDLVSMFPGEDIGISTPISNSMYHVALKFLSANPNYRTKLWEISGVGSEGNRKLIYFSSKKVLPVKEC